MLSVILALVLMWTHVRLFRPHNAESDWLNHMVTLPKLTLVCLLPSVTPLFPFMGLFISFFWGVFLGRVARRPPASTVDEGTLSRLLTPTQASLARSKSAAALSAEGTDSPGNLHKNLIRRVPCI